MPAPSDRELGRTRFAFLIVVVGLSAGGLGLYFSGDLARGPTATPLKPETPNTSVVGQPRSPFTLPDAEGRPRNIAEWDGKVLVINFWATWCAPCREEMPLLIEMQQRFAGQGLRTLGIAVDTPERANAFAEKLGVNYPSLFATHEAIEIGKRYGNFLGVLPYTVVVDRAGVVRYTHLGLIERKRLEEAISPLL